MDNVVKRICVGQGIKVLGESLSEGNRLYESVIYGLIDTVNITNKQYIYDEDGIVTPESVDLQNDAIDAYIKTATVIMEETKRDSDYIFSMLQLAYDSLSEKIEKISSNTPDSIKELEEIWKYIEDEMVLERFLF